MGIFQQPVKVLPLVVKGFQDSSEVADASAGNGLGIGLNLERPNGDMIFVIILDQCFQNGRELSFSETRPLPVGIIDVDMAERPRC